MATYGSDQLVAQRYLSARSTRDSVRSIWANFVFGDILLTMVQVGAGLALFAFYQHLPDLLPHRIEADKVLPHFISHQLPVGISGLILAALAAAIMSSIDSGIHSVATVCTVDFDERFWPTKPTDAQKLWFARASVPVLGCIVCVLAVLVIGGTGASILERGVRASGFLVGPILGIFLVAIFVRRAGAAAALIGALAGLLVGFVVAFGHLLPYVPLPEISFSLSLPCSAATTCSIGGAVALIWPKYTKSVTS